MRSENFYFHINQMTNYWIKWLEKIREDPTIRGDTMIRIFHKTAIYCDKTSLVQNSLSGWSNENHCLLDGNLLERG